MKYKIIPNDIIKSMIEFLDEIQFEAASSNRQEDLHRINFINWMISELMNGIDGFDLPEDNDEDADIEIDIQDRWDTIDNYKKQAKRAVLMEGAMKKFFEAFDKGMTNEEIIQDYATKGIQVPEQFVSTARKQYEGYKKLKLELEMSEKEFKNSATKMINNPDEGITGMEMDEKQLASGITNEKLDPVGQEDDDIDNDGDVDKTDDYLKLLKSKRNNETT